MPYIIDGHNLIGKLSSIDLADPEDEQKLIILLAEFLKAKDKQGIAFFDQGVFAGERRQKVGRLEIRFVRPPLEADDAIIQFLNRIKSEASNFILVSSDHRLQEAAKRAGARWMKSEDFASLVLTPEDHGRAPDKEDQFLSPQDIEDWERLFSSKED